MFHLNCEGIQFKGNRIAIILSHRRSGHFVMEVLSNSATIKCCASKFRIKSRESGCQGRSHDMPGQRNVLENLHCV